MTPQLRSLTNRLHLASAGLAVVLSPIPFADEIALLPLYGYLAVRVGREHGLSPGALPWGSLTAAAALGLGARAVLNLSFAFLPGISALSNAVTAVALTEALARHADRVVAAHAASPPDAAAAAG